MWTELPYILDVKNLESILPQLQGQIWHAHKGFIKGVAPCHNSLVVWKFGHNILYGCSVSSFQKIGGFIKMKFTSSLSPSKLKGQIKTCLEIYSLTEIFNLYTQNLPNLAGGKKNPFALNILFEIYGLQNRKVTCGYICTWHTLSRSWDHLPDKLFQTLKNHACLIYDFYMWYFDPHDGRQHPKPIHIFHPCRSSPSELQSPWEY